MKTLIIILLFISSVSFGQEIKTQTIIFTEIFVDEAEGGSFYMEYIDASGETHYSDMRFEEDIYIGDSILFDYDNGLLIFFNEEIAKNIIGKNIEMTYYNKEVKYFGVVPFVTNLKL